MDAVILRGQIVSGYGAAGYGADGYGDGSGSGSGGGYGVGYGAAGYGYGDGDWSGYGYGDGSGYGDTYGAYWLSAVKYFSTKWPAAQRARLAHLRRTGATIAFWCSTETGLAANGGRGVEPAAPGVVHRAPGPLKLCESGTLHATLVPTKWKGTRLWIVALIGEVIGNGEDKFGCLTREIIGEAIWNWEKR